MDEGREYNIPYLVKVLGRSVPTRQLRKLRHFTKATYVVAVARQSYCTPLALLGTAASSPNLVECCAHVLYSSSTTRPPCPAARS